MQTMGSVALGDPRRARRVVHTLTALAANPMTSLPAALAHPAGLKAAYRLLHSAAVTVEALLTPHWQATRTAAGLRPVCLLVQDTTEVDYTAHRATTGLGPIGNGRGQGFLLHSVLAIVPPTRQVLGLVHLAPRLRVAAPRRGERCSERRQRPRESDLWPEAVTAIGSPPPGTTWVHVGDRGADLFPFLQTCQQQGGAFLVRAAQDRRATLADGPPLHLLTTARALPPQATRPQDLPARPGQSARTATVALAWTALTLQPPTGLRAATAQSVWVLRVWEPDPPADVAPLEWVLVTSVPTTSLADAWERVDWYQCRWLVEDYHQALKTGCQLETSQLRDKDALWRLVALRAPVAVRLLQLRALARTQSAQPATTVLPADVVAVVAAKTGTTAAGMTADTGWRLLARLGGHQGRRRDGPPGWLTVWRGWLQVQTLVEGVHWARDGLLPTCG